MALEEIRSERVKKLRGLENNGIEGYPAGAVRTHRIVEVLQKFPAFVKGRKTNTIVGRIMARRGHGGATFADLQDEYRRTRATEWVSGNNFSLTQIGLMLGYANQSAFSAAYRRWAGTSPRNVRAQGRRSNGTADV